MIITDHMVIFLGENLGEISNVNIAQILFLLEVIRKVLPHQFSSLIVNFVLFWLLLVRSWYKQQVRELNAAGKRFQIDRLLRDGFLWLRLVKQTVETVICWYTTQGLTLSDTFFIAFL